eukprot:gene6139-7396_t
MSSSEGGGIDVMRVPLQQLEVVRRSLTQEVQTLTTAIKSLKHAQSKFLQSKDAVQQLKPDTTGKPTLIPLTESLYVHAELTDPSKVLVDIGTGYYIEKSQDDANNYFDRKIKYITEQLQSVQKVAAEKQREQAAVAEAYRIRLSQQQTQEQSSSEKSEK